MEWQSSNTWTNSITPLHGRGSLRHLHVVNKGANDRFLMFFDSAIVPKDGAIPVRVWALPTGGGLPVSFDHEIAEGGRGVQKGICLVMSSSAAGLVAVPTENDFLFDVGFDVYPSLK